MSSLGKLLNDLRDRMDQSQKMKQGEKVQSPRPQTSAPPSKVASQRQTMQVLTAQAYRAQYQAMIQQYMSVSPGQQLFGPFGGFPKPQYDESILPHRRTSEPVVGWRAWKLGKDKDGEPILLSVIQGTEWNGPVHRADRAPGVNDNFGVHSFKRVHYNTEYDQATVEGEVLLYGKTIVFERGIRAEAAMIRRLCVYPGGWEAGENEYDLWTLRVKRALWGPEGTSSVAENHALLASLSRRYDCEVTFIPRITPEMLEEKRVPMEIEPPLLIHEPTKEQVKWISESR